MASVERFRDLLAVADSSPLFPLDDGRAGAAEAVASSNTGPDQVPGLLVMHLDDTVGADLDPARERHRRAHQRDATTAQSYTVAQLAAKGLTLSSVQAAEADPVVKGASFANGTFTVPARTTAVFEERSTLQVDVRVQRGDGANVVNTRAAQVPLAVLSQDGFDPVADLDLGSLRFGRTGLEDSVRRCRPAATTTATASSTCSARCGSARAAWRQVTPRCGCEAARTTACASSARASVTTVPARGKPGTSPR